ncbi:hypothetical protein [Penaeicola halotolerans]|uniref:hypothetical protein n=1 Tax=Penaeicola halotolerans TaxID=2793196 RepID=UPI001CF87BC3|nr:hypothetical protein [Penaeicola halotolerans]
MKKLFTVFTVALMMVSCGPSTEEIIDTKEREVLKAHDLTMPEMGKINGYKRKALDKAAELDSLGDQDAANTYRDMAQTLEQANEGMMQWMRQFTVRTERADWETDETLDYLAKQKAFIDSVNNNIYEALELGKKTFDTQE